MARITRKTLVTEFAVKNPENYTLNQGMTLLKNKERAIILWSDGSLTRGDIDLSLTRLMTVKEAWQYLIRG